MNIKIFLFISLFLFGFETNQPQISLDEVIAQNKGKVILIDYWASWCKPCRKEMRHLPKLKEKYKDNVVFIYISFDLDKNKWIDASKKEKIDQEKYNFISSQLKRNKEGYFSDQITFKTNTLPTYLIFNKNGKLVNSNAPRLSQKELYNELDKYINE